MSEETNEKIWQKDLTEAAMFSPYKVNLKTNKKDIKIEDVIALVNRNDKLLQQLEKKVNNLVTLIKDKRSTNLIRNLKNRINQLEDNNNGNDSR